MRTMPVNTYQLNYCEKILHGANFIATAGALILYTQVIKLSD